MYRKDAVKKYAAPPAAGNPREAEAWAMSQAALRMMSAKEQNDKQAMVDAARLNWRLWTIIQADLLSPESSVPDDIRSNMLSLSNFVDKHTVAFLAQPRPEKLDVLINIDRELARGLYERPDAPAEAGGAEPAEPPPTVTSA